MLGEPIGTFTNLDTDAVGLRTISRYYETPLATETLAAIRSGALTAYSQHARIIEFRPNGRHDRLPVFDVTDAEMTEAGPTPEPADDGALILSVGGTELRAEPALPLDLASALAYMTAVTGLTTKRALQRIADERRQKQQQAQDRVADAENLARVIRHARRKIDIYGAERRQTGNAEAGQRWLAATRAERDALAELYELLCHDRALIHQVLTWAGAGGANPHPAATARPSQAQTLMHDDDQRSPDGRRLLTTAPLAGPLTGTVGRPSPAGAGSQATRTSPHPLQTDHRHR